jgi:hypothetical protein
MSFRRIAAFLAVASSAALAQSPSVIQQSAAIQRQAPLCQDRVPGWSARFAPAWKRWNEANGAAISKAESDARADPQLRMQLQVQAVEASSKLQAASPAETQQTCDAILKSIGG